MRHNHIHLLFSKRFRNFFLADIISGFGVGMTTVGANWYMLQQTHTSKLVGLYLTINVLAGFLMAPLAGALTDKYSRRNVILWSFVGRAIPMILIAGIFYLTGFNIWLMFILSIITGAGWITYMSASRSFIQVIMPLKYLGTANSFIEISLQVGMFMAGAISGIILHYAGFLVVLVVNILVFVIASLLILNVTKDKQPVNTNDAQNSGLKKGLSYVCHHQTIISLGLLSILPLIVTQLFNVSSPDYVYTILKTNSVVYGTADMLYGIGGLGAGLITSGLIAHFRQKPLMIMLFSLATLVLISLYFWHFIGLLFLSTFGLGFSNSALRVVTNTALMKIVKPPFMGRVTSLWNGLAQFMNIFASTTMGLTNDKFGANFGFLCMSFIMSLGIIASVLTLKAKRTTEP
ncbi:MFS transporter [Agrilactobacillus fermenti]|uniref:MFS transporter n=1 Tax=Agrilactobacillus fermenti TaxID=2586909 RepID=UPI001E34FC7E|nr:MFS transporter [Agrilactobacillus fermenti]MCD2255394.1 MFS transporter [Agrilactobacillus fermenti]